MWRGPYKNLIAVAITIAATLHAQTITISPLTVTFPKTVYDVSGATKSATINNTGGADLHIGAVTYSNQFSRGVITGQCAASNFTLHPAQSCPLAIVFRPTLNGAIKGFVIIQHDATNLPTPLVVQLSGTAVPQASPVPTSVDFGTVAVGSTSAAKLVRVKNNGTFTVGINAVISGDYAVTPNGCANVAPGATCDFSITFKPTIAAVIPGSLGLFSGAAVPPVKLIGTGSGMAQSAITFSPSTLPFGKQPQGLGNGPNKVVTLNNTGLNSITINGTIGSDYVFSTTPNSLTTCNPGTIVPPAGTCKIEITFFTPGSLIPGTYNGAITVATSDVTSPRVFAVSGTDAANPFPSPASLSFPLTAVGTSSAAKMVKLTNVDPDNEATVDFIIGTDYIVTNSNCPTPPATLASGGSCNLSIEFKPTVVGTPNGNLNQALSLHSLTLNTNRSGFSNVNLLGKSQ